MPNWVFNRVTITGDEANLNKFIEKAKQPYPTFHKGDFVEKEDGTKTYDASIVKEQEHTSALSFWNFKKPENVEVYFGASDYKPEGYDALSTEEKMAVSMRFSSDGWYDWNIREWGTKWDASDSELGGDSKLGEISYAFNTAWSPAEGAFREMVAQHPELSFEFYCEEEQGWGVEFEGTDGELSVTKEWDIPNSHQDYVDLDWECRACEYFSDSGDQDDLHDDCPGNKKATEEAVQQMEDISELIG